MPVLSYLAAPLAASPPQEQAVVLARTGRDDERRRNYDGGQDGAKEV